MNNHQPGGTGLSDEDGIRPLHAMADEDQLVFTVGCYYGARIGRFGDGHKYESYCTCIRCGRETANFEFQHAADKHEAESKLSCCPFCGSGAHLEYEGVVHLNINNGFPSNGVWVRCDSCTCSRGLSDGMTSQEDRVGEYSSFNDAVDGWNERAT